jgi:hypothetical protein
MAETQITKHKAVPDYVIAALILASLYTLGLMIYAWHGGSFNVVKLLGLGAWSISPYLLLIAYILKMRFILKRSAIVMLGSFIVMFFGLAILTDGFFIHQDALSGLLFVFMPPFQSAGVLITLGITHWKED